MATGDECIPFGRCGDGPASAGTTAIEAAGNFRVNRPGDYRPRLWPYQAWAKIPPRDRPAAVELPGYGFLALIRDRAR